MTRGWRRLYKRTSSAIAFLHRQYSVYIFVPFRRGAGPVSSYGSAVQNLSLSRLGERRFIISTNPTTTLHAEREAQAENIMSQLELPRNWNDADITGARRSVQNYSTTVARMEQQPATRLSVVKTILGAYSAVDYVWSRESTLPSGWGQPNGRFWFEVACSLFHEPLRSDIACLRRLNETKELHFADEARLIQFKTWIEDFALTIDGFTYLKYELSDARVKRGFVCYVNPDYHRLNQLLAEVEYLTEMLLDKYRPKKDEDPADLKSGGGGQRPPFVLRDEIIVKIYEVLVDLILECERCMEREETLLCSLLKLHSSEDVELEAIVSAFNRFNYTSRSEGVALGRITHHMKHWCRDGDRLLFLKCLPVFVRLLLYTRWSRDSFDVLLQPHSRGLRNDRSFPRLPSPSLWTASLSNQERHSCPSLLESGDIGNGKPSKDTAKSRQSRGRTDCWIATPRGVSVDFTVVETPTALRASQ